MPKIQFNRKQYTVTVSPDEIRRMGWKKGTEVYIAKDPDRNILYIEKMPVKTKNSGKYEKKK